MGASVATTHTVKARKKIVTNASIGLPSRATIGARDGLSWHAPTMSSPKRRKPARVSPGGFSFRLRLGYLPRAFRTGAFLAGAFRSFAGGGVSASTGRPVKVVHPWLASIKIHAAMSTFSG